MCARPSFMLLLCCILATFQFFAGRSVGNTDEVFPNEDKIRKREINSVSHIVYPELYDLEKKRLHGLDETSTITLILKGINFTYYIDLDLNEDLNEVPVHFENNVFKSSDHGRRCHFHGKIITKPTGFVAISTCAGNGKVTGLLMMAEKVYFLSPSSNVNKMTTENEHYLHEYVNENTEFCGINNARDLLFGEEEVLENDFVDGTDRYRVKRQTLLPTNRKVIEVAIFVDKELYKKIQQTASIDAQQATVQRVMSIMNQVQLIYNYSSLETKLKIVMVKLQILKDNEDAPNPANGNIDKYLKNFCNWQQELYSREGNVTHWDYAIMLTGFDLNRVLHDVKFRTLGLSWVNGMCRSNYSCIVNEGTSFVAGLVIAHEIAHSLGVSHDGDNNNCSKDKYLMSAKTGPGKVSWSSCSNIYLNNFFRNGGGECLKNEPSPAYRSYNLEGQILPGQKYTLSEQCILSSGWNYIPIERPPYHDVCRLLWCSIANMAKPTHPALDGSSCAPGKVCLEGQCKSVRNATSMEETLRSNGNITSGTYRQLSKRETEDEPKDELEKENCFLKADNILLKAGS